MEAAKVLAGFSLGEADLLRRAMGKKIKSEMDAQRAGFVAGCERVNAIPAGQGQRAVRPDRQVRRLRLQQEPRRRLRADRLPDRLAEGASSGRILRRLDVLRHPPDRQARHLRRRHAADRRRLPAARDQRQRGRVLGRGAWRGPCRPLRARRAQGRRREGDGAAGRGAPRSTAASPASTISPRGSIRACSTAARSRASPAAARSTASPSAGRSHAAAETILSAAASAADARTSGQGGLFGEGPANVVPIRMPTRRDLDARPAHGRREGELRLLFLRPSGRQLPPPRRWPTARGASPSSPRCRRRPTAAAPAR